MAGVTNERNRGSKRLKWTEQMYLDCLDCERKAQDLVVSENPPVNENGRRKGYIKVMHDLWQARGYEQLGLTSQNLRDRAARLEKVMEDTSRQSNGNGIDVIDMVESGDQDETGVKTQNNEISKSTVAIDTTAENANLSTFTNLHETVGDFND